MRLAVFIVVTALFILLCSLPIKLQLIVEELAKEKTQTRLRIFWQLKNFRANIFSIQMKRGNIYPVFFNRQSSLPVDQRWRLLKKLYNAIKIETFLVGIICGLPDPADTAELFGMSRAIAGLAAVYLPFDIQFVPEFHSPGLKFKANIIFHISILRLVVLGSEVSYQLLRNKIFFNRNPKNSG